MRKSYLIIIIFIFASFNINSQGSNKLTGKIIGCLSHDYETNASSTTVNLPENAFDGDLNTFYASEQRSYTWVGLELESEFVIDSVGYASVKERETRLSLGVFEGANNPDFGDAVVLLMIKKSSIESGKIVYQKVDCNKSFKYVRYVGPYDKRCNIAEVEFYGHKDDTQQNIFRYYQLTNIPTVSIHTETKGDITSKEEYVKGIASFVSKDGTEIYSDSVKIRGRGNATWNLSKKPYKIKLYNKTNLLGNSAKAKDWTLLSNMGDKTLMRNFLAFDISRMAGFEYTPSGQPVDLFLNGEYKGCYQLCDQVEVNKNRVNVEKISPNAASISELSGGYFIEIDSYAYNEASWFLSSRMGTPVTIKYPDDDEITPVQKNYIQGHFNKFEEALYSSVYLDANSGFRRYLDLETFIKYFVLQEFTGNTDAFWSVNLYKHKGNDRFYTGPVWDFDIAFDNDFRTYPLNNLKDTYGDPIYVYEYENSSQAGQMRRIVKRIVNTSEAGKEIYNCWYNLHLKNGLTKDNLYSLIDKYAKEMEESQKLNFMRWDINAMVLAVPVARGTYKAEVDYLKYYIERRIDWMNEMIGVKATDADQYNFKPVNVWSNENLIYISSDKLDINYSIYNSLGIAVDNGVIKDYTTIIPLQSSGIYIVKVEDVSFRTVLK
ncbi:MAG: CotH kinase family protein [Bacteroidales bacterium]|nr:CotH kinase family protein [Bacteroidales bacterium]